MSIEPIPVPGTPRYVEAWFTTRAGGVSGGPWKGLNLGSSTGDDRGAVRENRRRLCNALDIDPERATLGFQVHGSTIREIPAPSRPGRFTGGLSGWPAGDGLATRVPGLPLVVLGADCLPVLAWSLDEPRVGAAHAGWRGLVEGVLRNLVGAIGDAARTGVAIGPGVGPCCYPVDGPLRARFAERFGPQTVVGEAVDLTTAARLDLQAAGVPERSIHWQDACSSCDATRFFSHRRDGAQSGRQAGVVWIGAR